jgi:CRISPR/Cas system-associated protein Cas7 (RAMP superfamily)
MHICVMKKKIYKKKVNTIVVVQSVPVAHAHAITSTENFWKNDKSERKNGNKIKIKKS